jgi:DNA recombination protein RmuC
VDFDLACQSIEIKLESFMESLLLWIITFSVIIIVLALMFLLFRTREQGGNRLEIRDELRAGREESQRFSSEFRQELTAIVKTEFGSITGTQKEKLDALAQQLKDQESSTRQALEEIRKVFDNRMEKLQESNEKKLEEMRQTVDEKLHDTLEKRLGESFKQVSEQLQSVYTGLGEMQKLATGVGDLKRVLTNVKARGTWAEVQLGNLLEQVLTPAQYAKSVQVNPNSSEMVDFAVRLPGSSPGSEAPVWLPIDSKFPQEDYERLQMAGDQGDHEAVEQSRTALMKRIREEAKSIQKKYILPPHTTDFAILFLATEGLYAEALRDPVLSQELQQQHRVILAGPTTLLAMLNSLRMGFQTVAIEKRASEVWHVLGAVKTEFHKFGEVLDKVQKQLGTASTTIEKTKVRTRAMERTLRSVEELPEPEAVGLLGVADLEADDQ